MKGACPNLMRSLLVGFSVLLPSTAIITAIIPSAAAEPPTMTRRGLATVVETSHLLCEIRPDVRKRGVVRCRYKPSGYEVVPDVPKHALLMPEWLLRPGSGRHGIFWEPLNARPNVTVEEGSVVFSVSADQTKDWNMDVSFRYTPRRDWIDFECRIVPHVAIKDFEFLFASYIIEDMESTWVSAAMPTGEVFKKIDNRRTVPYGPPFSITRDAKTKAYLTDGRWKLSGAEASKELWQDFFYKRPILIAMKESTGLAAVTLVDPKTCTLLTGQHHHVETAHDFTFSGDLKPGKTFLGRARLVVRPIGKFPEATKQIDAMWNEFMESLRDADRRDRESGG